MSPLEIAVLLGLVGYAIYRESIRRQVTGRARFQLAFIYAAVGVGAGGFTRPGSTAEVILLAVSLLLSAVVGLARGRLIHLWRASDGTIWRQGTAASISLFLALFAVKFAMGAIAYEAGWSDDGGFGEVLVLIAVMVAFQAEIVWRRAHALSPTSDQPNRPVAPSSHAEHG